MGIRECMCVEYTCKDADLDDSARNLTEIGEGRG